MNLSNNNITEIGMRSLIQVFSSGQNTTLETLYILNNKLTFFNYNQIRQNLTIITKLPQIYFKVAKLFENYKSVEDLKELLKNYVNPIQQQKIRKQQQQQKIRKQQQQQKIRKQQELNNFLNTGLWEFFQANKKKYRDTYSYVSEPVFENIFRKPPSKVQDKTEELKYKKEQDKTEELKYKKEQDKTEELKKKQLEKEYNHVKGILTKLDRIHKKMSQFYDVTSYEPIRQLLIHKTEAYYIDKSTTKNPSINEKNYYTEEQALEKFKSTDNLSLINYLIPFLNHFLNFDSVKKDNQSQKNKIGVLQKKISDIETAFEEKSDEIEKVLKKLREIKEQILMEKASSSIS